MEENNQNKQPYYQQFSDNEESSFNLKEWLLLFLRYWYLFVLFALLGLGLAYLKNRSWIESYKTTGTMLIEDSRGGGSNQVFMQGFGVQSGYKNLDNQLVMLSSYDFISRVVDSLPSLKIDYISKGRFKTRNLYKNSPIEITTEYIDPRIYDVPLKLSINNDGSFVITDEDGSAENNLNVKGRFGEPIEHVLFFITVNPTIKPIQKRDIYFTFRSKESLIADFMSRLELAFVSDGSSVLGISLTGETPDRDIDFINKLSSVFLSENLNLKNEAANKTIKFIDEQLDVILKSLLSSEGAMTQFRKENQIIDLSSRSSELLSKATEYDSKQSELNLKESYFNYLSNYLNSNIESQSLVVPSSIGLNEPMLMNLIQQFNDLIVKRNDMSEKNPLYAKYSREIEDLKPSIKEVLKNIRASLDIEKDNLNKNLTLIQQDISTLPAKEMQYIGIERKYKVDDNYYTFFLQKRAEAAIQKASNSPDNNILDKARIVALTNGNTKSRNYLLLLLIGLMIPTLFVIIKELSNTTIRDEKDIEKNSKFPLIGTVKHTKTADSQLTAKHPQSSFTEMFRVLRTRIEFLVQRKTKIAILITSPESADGKTYFSTNLAATYGMTGMKTILVDMDIRKPSINDKLNISEDLGVTNYLIGEKELDDLILRKEEFNFDILLAGTIPPNPGELIRSDQLKNMFAKLREMYDYIIVDSSPIGLVADAYSLAPIMDVNLMIARSEKTNKSYFKRLNSQIKEDKLKNFYIVLNDVKIEGRSYYRYSNKYNYGYGYGYGNKKGKNQYTHYYQDDEEI
jgi:capsular exopolysaccharide synthesis family protein